MKRYLASLAVLVAVGLAVLWVPPPVPTLPAETMVVGLHQRADQLHRSRAWNLEYMRLLRLADWRIATSLAFAADVTTAYGTNGQTITCTLASLATGNTRSCAAIDNGTNKFMDVLIFLKFLTGGSGATATGYVNIYAGGTVNQGTDYTDNAGTDAALTPKNVRVLTTCAAGANSTTYRCGPFSLRPVFGGSLPERWFIAIENQTGTTLDSTESNHAKLYQGVKGSVT